MQGAFGICHVALAWLLVQGAFGIHHVALHHFLRGRSLRNDPFLDVIMRYRMVRDPGNRFTENASLDTFLENTRGPSVSDGTNVSSNSQDEFGNSGIIKCFARLSRNTLPWKSPAPGKKPMLFFRPNRASNTFRVSYLSTASIFVTPGKLACLRKPLCIVTGLKQAVLHTTGSPAPNLQRSWQGIVQYFNFSFLSEWTQSSTPDQRCDCSKCRMLRLL